MISCVLCPFSPALQGLHRLPFNQLLLLFLGMQLSTGSEKLWPLEILLFAAWLAQVVTPCGESYSK